MVVGVEDGPGTLDVGGVGGGHIPRQVQHRIQPGSDPAGLGALVAGALQFADLAHRSFAHVVGQLRRLDAGAVVVAAVGFVLAQFLTNRGQLLTQQELLLRLLHAVADLAGDLVVHLDLGQVVAGPRDQGGQTLCHVGSFEHLSLLDISEVRRVTGGVGQCRRIAQFVDRVDDLPGLATLQHGQYELLVLGGQFAHLVGDRGFGHRFDLDPQRRAGPGGSRSDVSAGFALEDRRRFATGEAAELHDRRDDAVGGITVVQSRGDQEFARLRGLRGVDGGACGIVQFDRDHHAGEQDGVGQEQHRQAIQFAHVSSKVKYFGLNFLVMAFVPQVVHVLRERNQTIVAR